MIVFSRSGERVDRSDEAEVPVRQDGHGQLGVAVVVRRRLRLELLPSVVLKVFGQIRRLFEIVARDRDELLRLESDALQNGFVVRLVAGVVKIEAPVLVHAPVAVAGDQDGMDAVAHAVIVVHAVAHQR